MISATTYLRNTDYICALMAYMEETGWFDHGNRYIRAYIPNIRRTIVINYRESFKRAVDRIFYTGTNYN